MTSCFVCTDRNDDDSRMLSIIFVCLLIHHLSKKHRPSTLNSDNAISTQQASMNTYYSIVISLNVYMIYLSKSD